MDWLHLYDIAYGFLSALYALSSAAPWIVLDEVLMYDGV